MGSYRNAVALLIVLSGACPLHAQDWESGTKSDSWLDPNFVPCEGMGAGATGNIDVRVGYMKKGDVVRVTDWQLRTRYSHDHQPSAGITWEAATGGQKSMNLQTAWFPIMGPNDGSRYLFLARNGSQSGSEGQTPFEMKSGSDVKISVVTVFPQSGGTCVASFSDELTLP